MQSNQRSSTTTLVAIGIGAAVFFVLGRFLSIPTGVPNTSLETTYPFLSLMAIVFGPFAGGLIGLIGHALKDVTTYGLWWSWVISSGIVGLGYGFLGRFLSVDQGVFTRRDALRFNLGQIIVNFFVWALVAPTLDILIYSEPANKVFVQGLVSGTLNSVAVGILGTILLATYSKTRTQSGSLKKE